MAKNNVPQMTGPTKAELRQHIQDQQTKEMLSKIAGQFAIKIGNAFVAILQNFSPNIDVGLQALVNVLVSTEVRNGSTLEALQEKIAKAYSISKEAHDKLKAGTTTEEDPIVATTTPDGKSSPLIIVPDAQ